MRHERTVSLFAGLLSASGAIYALWKIQQAFNFGEPDGPSVFGLAIIGALFAAVAGGGLSVDLFSSESAGSREDAPSRPPTMKPPPGKPIQ
ncbi:MAG: hypothetical protein HY556_02590 [Euryarchaeota archaeon]|nr:hypothetical protein [Euryarchaeota archaeon]